MSRTGTAPLDQAQRVAGRLGDWATGRSGPRSECPVRLAARANPRDAASISRAVQSAPSTFRFPDGESFTEMSRAITS
jgi:hypothetical protein